MLTEIKKRVQEIYDNGGQCRINVTVAHPRIQIRQEPAVIVGVYRNVFRIRESSSGYPQEHTLQYNDVLTGQIEFLEA